MNKIRLISIVTALLLLFSSISYAAISLNEVENDIPTSSTSDTDFAAQLESFTPYLSVSPSQLIVGGSEYYVELSANRYLENAEITLDGVLSNLDITNVEQTADNKLMLTLTGELTDLGDGTITVSLDDETFSSTVASVSEITFIGQTDGSSISLLDDDGNEQSSATPYSDGVFALTINTPINSDSVTFQDSLGETQSLSTLDADRNYINLSSASTLDADIDDDEDYIEWASLFDTDENLPEFDVPKSEESAIVEALTDTKTGLIESEAMDLLTPDDQLVLSGLDTIGKRQITSSVLTGVSFALGIAEKLFVEDPYLNLLDEVLTELDVLESMILSGFEELEEVELQSQFNIVMEPVLDIASLVQSDTQKLQALLSNTDSSSRQMEIDALQNSIYSNEYDELLIQLETYMVGGGGTQSIPEMYISYLEVAYDFEHELYEPLTSFYQYITNIAISATQLQTQYYTSLCGPYNPQSEFIDLSADCYDDLNEFISFMYSDCLALDERQSTSDEDIFVTITIGESDHKAYMITSIQTGETFYLPTNLSRSFSISTTYDQSVNLEYHNINPTDISTYTDDCGSYLWMSNINSLLSLAPDGTYNYYDWLEGTGLDQLPGYYVMSSAPSKEYSSSQREYYYTCSYYDLKNGGKLVEIDTRYTDDSFTVTFFYI